MGMFDSILTSVTCPNCGEPGVKELQTKDLECVMRNYNIGDNIGTLRYRYLSCTASCSSSKCRQWAKDNRPSYVWDCIIYIDERGNITNKIELEEPRAFNPHEIY